MEAVEIMAEGTMKAFVLHAEDKGMQLVDHQGAVDAMRVAVKAGWKDYMDTVRTALEAHMS